MPARLLLSLCNAAETYFDPKAERLARPITGGVRTIEPNKLLVLYDEEALKGMMEAIKALYQRSMTKRFAAQPCEAKRIYIDPSLYNIPVSVGDRSSTIQDTSCALMGTHFPCVGRCSATLPPLGKRSRLPSNRHGLELSCRFTR